MFHLIHHNLILSPLCFLFFIGLQVQLIHVLNVGLFLYLIRLLYFTQLKLKSNIILIFYLSFLYISLNIWLEFRNFLIHHELRCVTFFFSLDKLLLNDCILKLIPRFNVHNLPITFLIKLICLGLQLILSFLQ